MIEFYGPSWFFTYMQLAHMSEWVRDIGTPGNPAPTRTRVGPAGEMTEAERKSIRHLAQSFTTSCEALGMHSTALAARLVDQYVSDRFVTPPMVHVALDGLLSQASKELGDQKFVWIRPDAHQWVTETHVLAPDVKPPPSSFPSADPHLWDAGNAYAVGLYTACVYHLMCAAEIGLRAFAEHLGVKSIKTGRKNKKRTPVEWAQWELILEEITERVEAKSVAAKKSAAAKASDRAFHRGVLAEFHGFKDMYRNDVMHVRVRYGSDAAASALEKVNSFMRRLGERVHE